MNRLDILELLAFMSYYATEIGGQPEKENKFTSDNLKEYIIKWELKRNRSSNGHSSVCDDDGYCAYCTMLKHRLNGLDVYNKRNEIKNKTLTDPLETFQYIKDDPKKYSGFDNLINSFSFKWKNS